MYKKKTKILFIKIISLKGFNNFSKQCLHNFDSLSNIILNIALIKYKFRITNLSSLNLPIISNFSHI